MTIDEQIALLMRGAVDVISEEELAKKLMSIRPGLPIILCTGFSDMITEEDAKAIGISGFFMKPLVTNEIANTIRRVLDAGK